MFDQEYYRWRLDSIERKLLPGGCDKMLVLYYEACRTEALIFLLQAQLIEFNKS